MENFKITIDVNVNLNDNVVGFFGALAELTMIASQKAQANPVEAKHEPQPGVKAEEVKPKRRKAEAKPEPQPEVKAEEVKAEEVKAEEVKAEEVKAEEVKAEEVKAEEVKAEEVKAEPAVTLEDLRTLVKDKAIQGDARQAIKNKLSEMGAERVTALAPEQYADFYEFLKSL
jgi:hypothetical protein